MNFEHILSKQKSFFRTQNTKILDFRIEQLLKFKKAIETNEEDLYEAIYLDYGKSKFDAYTTEISFVLKDIDYYIKNIKNLAKPKCAKTNIANQLGSSKVYSEPLGNALIIGAWNYPYQLSLSPAVAAIAAGNTVILKPSEVAEHTMKAMSKLVNENFDENYFHVIEGGVPETTELLKLKFNKIFFTGSTRVGKIVYEAAAKNLIPVTLELGGKSPAFVTQNANIDIAAKRIVWGKFLNAGQTCVAPDYLMVEDSIKDELVTRIKYYIDKFNYQADSPHYTRIITENHFDRLTNLIIKDRVIIGGQYDKEKLFIEPTVLDDVTWDDEIMQEEIFGPILPILTFSHFQEAIVEVMDGEKPLAAYLFSDNSNEKRFFCDVLSFGGGCINDCVMHLTNEYIPFGGVGYSGIGNYHGKHGFATFSHEKAILSRATWGEPTLKYPPYSEEKLEWIKRLM